MSKCILEFNLPEEHEEAQLAFKAGEMHLALLDIAQEIFRPARKHGYSNPEIEKLLTHINAAVLSTAYEGDTDHPRDEWGRLDATDLIALLEKRFYEILENNGVSL